LPTDQDRFSEEMYSLDLREPEEFAGSYSFQSGGTSPRGETFAFTNYYLTRNGRPCLPIMGEFHYSRFPRRFWEEELRKMQAGGITIVASYIFWIHVEEEEGVFDWSGERDLRSFVEICQALGMPIILRIGPFVHGECRNGGLPDWLYGRGIAVRSNDERYLCYVRRFFAQIAEQVKGFLFKDGGAIMGIQLENEYMHAGAPWETTHKQGVEWVSAGTDGSAHLQILKQLAVEAGLEVPIYTCTAWGGAAVPEDGFLPTQAAYAFTPWEPDPLHEQAPTGEFLFLNRHAQPRSAGKIEYDTSRYPYAYSELGGGTQMTYAHRPVISPECVQAMAIVALGSGTNWLGYYMYHGGSNPPGKHAHLNEYTTPRVSYDFQAPVREYGQLNASYHHLRVLHLFLHEWGETLAPMIVAVPPGSEQLTPDNTHTLRYAVRRKDGSGFLFLSNYQDHIEMQDHEGIQLRLELPDESLVVPEGWGLTLRKDVSAILPFNLRLEREVLLKYATAQPVTKLHEVDQTTYVFFAPEGIEAEFVFDRTTYQWAEVASGVSSVRDEREFIKVEAGLDCQIHITALDGTHLQILVLTQEQALTLWKVHLWGEDRLILANGPLMSHDESLELCWQDRGVIRLAAYPSLPDDVVTSADLHFEATEGVFSRYTLVVPERSVALDIVQVSSRTIRITLPAASILEGLHDVFLKIDYLGDVGSAYLDGRLIGDNFASELPWEIGLKRFLLPSEERELILHFSPLARDAPTGRYLQKKIAAGSTAGANELLEIFSITTHPEYHARLTRQKGAVHD